MVKYLLLSLELKEGRWNSDLCISDPILGLNLVDLHKSKTFLPSVDSTVFLIG